MKIYSSKLDDLRNERRAYDSEVSDLQAKVDQGTKKWREAYSNVGDVLSNAVISEIGDTSLNLDVSADFGSFGSDYYQVNVKYEPRMGDSASLRWNWSAKLDEDGNVVKDSGSWSGLDATSADLIANLKESVRVIEILNDIDWKKLLSDNKIPDYNDFGDEELSQSLRRKKAERPNYEQLEFEAEIESYIGQDILLRGKSGTDDPMYRTGTEVYYAILKDTPSKYRITEFLGSNVDTGRVAKSDIANGYDRLINKEKLIKLIKRPIETYNFK